MKNPALLLAITFAVASISLTAQASEAPKEQPSETDTRRKDTKTKDKPSKEYRKIRKLLLTPVAKMKVSARTLNLLEKNGMKIVGHFVGHSKAALAKRGFDKEALEELGSYVDDGPLSFGMDVAFYKLDED